MSAEPDRNGAPVRRRLHERHGLVAASVAAVALALYLVTLNPTFGFIDKGELVAAASTLGIPHPTGYPTIMMLGYLFTKVIPARPVLALNLMSALLSAAGVAVMTLLFAEMLGGIWTRATATRSGRKGRKGRTAAEPERADVPGPTVLIAGAAALFVGLTATWWNQANGFEVYSLHAVLFPLSVLLFLRYLRASLMSAVIPARGISRDHVAFSIVLGLAFTNHLTVALLAPGLLTVFFWTAAQSPRARAEGGALRLALKEIGRLIPGFVMGLLPYLYLPLRAAADPIFNWGDPETLKRFVDHVRGRQYSVWMGSGEVFSQQTSFFFGKLPSELAYVGALLAGLGIVALWRRNRRLSVMVALFFVTCVIWAGMYDILEIEPYFMLAVLAIGIWVAFGAQWIFAKYGTTLALVVAFGTALLVGVMNLPMSNERQNLVVEQMTRNVLNHAPRNALIISAQWDFWVAGSWYMQAVERLRPDVAVIDQELLRRSWYLDQMAQAYPDIMGRVASQVDRFRRQVTLFEHDQPYDEFEIQAAYIGMINAIIDSAMVRRPVLVTGEVAPEMGAAYRRVPNYLALRLVRDSGYVAQSFPAYDFSFWPGRVDHYAAKAYELYARSSYARALYEAQFGNDSLAMQYFDHALSFDPGWTLADVPDQALNGEEQTRGMIEFFNSLRNARR